MNKAFLVALREYMENLKTKAFWIGIMAFPIILVLAFAIPVWLEQKKDVRKYAVLDNSGWLLDAVEKRAAAPDLEKIIEFTLDRYEKGGQDFEELPQVLQVMAPDWSMAGEKGVELISIFFTSIWSGPEGDQITKMFDKIASGEDKETESRLIDMLESKGRGQDLDFFRKAWPQYKRVKEWWQNLSSKGAEKFGSGISRSRYARIDVDLFGPNPEAKLKKMLKENKLFAYFVIGKDPIGQAPVIVNGTGGIVPKRPGIDPAGDGAQEKENAENVCKYVSNNLTDMDLKNWFSRHANQAVRVERLKRADVAKETAKWLEEAVVFDARQVSEAGVEEEVAEEDTLRQWAPVVFVYLLWISIFTITQMLLTNTIEEKSNKIMEVLLSSVSPLQLMAGKIIGIAGTGLTMVVSWVFFFLVAIKYMPVLLGKEAPFDLTMLIRDPLFLGSFVAYFILGYLLLSAILVGIGSVCNSLKEAQNLMAPVTIILIVPLLAMVPIGQDPNGTIAKVLSYIPPFTPFVMMNRAAGPPSTMEYVVTTILLAVSIAFALWAAAKVFRVGILMTGKPPKLFEIFRWVRAPVGMVRVVEENGEKK